MTEKDKLIIANISGFYGDRLSAPKEMLEGGSVDFLTGDYLAELTMAILYKAKLKRPESGFANTFLKQMEEVMGLCLEKGVKVVVNAGGMNPSGLAKGLMTIAERLKLSPKIAFIDGDDLLPRLIEDKSFGSLLTHLESNKTLLESGMSPLSANAYMGCWGIVEALNHEADIVVTGRVADTSLAMGPAAYHFGWERDNWDALAGAAVAGHVIECSGQATGGNYSFFEEVPSFTNLGFPLAEMHSDGSSIITKHPGTGGLVSVGTVTSQLLYEINEPNYITPDVIAHFGSIKLEQIEKDRVRILGVKGSPPTNTSKVTVNCDGGYRNSLTFNIVGLDVGQKVEIIKQCVLESYGGDDVFDSLEFSYHPTHKEDPSSNEEAMARLQISCIDRDPQKAGKLFTSGLVEIVLCCVPGICWSHAPTPAKPRIVHFPALIDKKHITQRVNVNGINISVEEVSYYGNHADYKDDPIKHNFSFENDETTPDHLGRLFATHSGDKGGNANLGIWAKTPESFAFLEQFLTVDKLKHLLTDTAEFEIIRYEFPNLLGLNFYLLGFLGEGVAANTKLDAQAKTLGEYLRAKIIDIPISLIP